jgi:hypothetical protein
MPRFGGVFLCAIFLLQVAHLSIANGCDLCNYPRCKHGEPHWVSQFLEKHWSKISPEPNSGCWLWEGAANPDGYGRVKIGRDLRLAHRAAYQTDVGPIPAGMQVDHLCRVCCCCNPDHLEAVTPKENMRRALPFRSDYSAPKSNFCRWGHDLRVSGTYAHPHGFTVCRQCKRTANKRSYLKGKTK